MELLFSVLNPEVPLSIKALAIIFLVLTAYVLLLYGVIFAILYPATWGSRRPSVQARKIQSQSPSRRDIRREIHYALLAILVFNANTLLVLLLIRYDVFPFFHKTWFAFPWYAYLGLMVPAALIGDVYSYGMHRLLHTKWMYRWVHKVHHESLYPSPIVAIALHPIEAWIVVLYLPLVAFLLPSDLFFLLFLQHYMIFIGIRNELGYQLGGKVFTRLRLYKVFSTSLFHVMHHIYPKFNYGLSSRWVDRLFKTEQPFYDESFLRLVGTTPPARNRGRKSSLSLELSSKISS